MEDGSTPFTRLLDDAFCSLIEFGDIDDGIEENEQEVDEEDEEEDA